MPDSGDLFRLRTEISLCFDKEDPSLDEREITREEVMQGRESIAAIERILSKAIGRLEEQRGELASALTNGTTEHPEFITEEVESYGLFATELTDMKAGLAPYWKYFALSTMKNIKWQVHAEQIYMAFRDSVPDREGKPWGVSVDGPAVLFVRLALEYVLSYIAAVKQPTWQLPSKRSVADALRKSKVQPILQQGQQSPSRSS